MIKLLRAENKERLFAVTESLMCKQSSNSIKILAIKILAIKV